MNSPQEIPVISSDAGNDPNSPAGIMKKAKEQDAQIKADTLYDDIPPERESFQDFQDTKRTHEITLGLFLASSILLFLYAAAPKQI